MSSLKEFVRNNFTMHFWARVLQNCSSDEYKQMVIDISEHPALCRIDYRGELHPENLYYELMIDDYGNNSGFFALFNETLKRLELSKRLGAIPYIYWKNSAYSEKSVSYTDNVFEYYFKQPCDITRKELMECSNVVSSRQQDGFPIDRNSLYLQLMNRLNEISEVYRKYIELNDNIAERIKKDLNSLSICFEKTVGVHVRGTDYGAGWKGHPVMVTLDEYITETRKMLCDTGLEDVFLATDDLRAISAFRSAFGNKVFFYEDVFRGEGSLGTHYIASERDNHHYKLGFEVIRDVYTLAKCRTFIGGVSQVGFAVRVINLAENENFRNVIILDKGTNAKGIVSSEFNKEFLQKGYK